MGFWSKLVGASIASPIEAVGGVIDELHTSREEKDAAKIVMEKLRQEPARLQAAINRVEAQHRTIFVAGWRPFIGWVCGLALAYIWLMRPILGDMMGSFGHPLPRLEISAVDVIALLGPMLGLGTLRTTEKMAGKAK